MTAHLTGTVVDGALQLDAPLALPNHSRVTVHVEPLATEGAGPSAAFEAFCQLTVDRPLRLDGQRPTREELHERR